MGTQYRCGTDRRRALVRDAAALNGIDYLTVDPGETTLRVHFLHDLPGTGGSAVPASPAPALTGADLVIDGGVRFPGIRVVTVASAGSVLTVTVDRPGDFSVYQLRLRRPDDDDLPPVGFDAALAAVRFTFKVDCPSDFDCRTEDACPPDVPDEPEIDYLAKDYDSFRRLMLDRMSVLLPEWTERDPADIGVALVELLAYAGDHLSSFQDAVANEAYLGTARRRASVRRHARLLDYRMHDGCNARTWIHVEVRADLLLPAHTPILSRSPSGDDRRVAEATLDALLDAEGPVVFETAAALAARAAHDEIRFHTWSEDDCCLPAGATRATLRRDGAVALAAGDLLLLEEVRGPSGLAVDADPAHRQVVRLTRVRATEVRNGVEVPLEDPLDATPIVEVEWDRRDALAFPLCISVLAADGTQPRRDLSVARGNIVPADHGATRPLPLAPDRAPADGPYRPIVDGSPVTCATPFAAAGPAAGALAQDPVAALPALVLVGDDARWGPQHDLLASDPFAPDLVAEIDAAGVAQLRFGDGAAGRRPSTDSVFTAVGRVGNGAAGNVGADSLTRVVIDDDGVLGARNPLPALGGTDPEPAERARLVAPRAFRRQERAVTEADYAAIASRRPEVGHAAARIRWTGSWYTAVVTVDRPGGEPADDAFRADLLDGLDLYRMAGVDLDLGRPADAPLDIVLEVCVTPDQIASNVKRAVLDALSTRRLASGSTGFFHPDRWTFGQPVYLSGLYRAVQQVDGIAWVVAQRFQRLGRAANHELEDGLIRLGALEIARLDNDPSFEERGRLELRMRGGR